MFLEEVSRVKLNGLVYVRVESPRWFESLILHRSRAVCLGASNARLPSDLLKRTPRCRRL